jgi:signal transduction histidine kinase/DNA-binding response OmpR family regulator
MANERILIIEPSEENVEYLTNRVLEPNGYRVLVTADGETGLELAQHEQPDLILMALELPSLTAMDILYALNGPNVHIPVIVMTLAGSAKPAVQVFRLGVRDYILKPFEANEMLESVERALAESRLRRERDELTERLVTSNKNLEQRVRELNTLFGIGKSVTAMLDQERLLSRLVEAAIYLTNAETGSLMLIDTATSELYVVAASGMDDRVARSLRLRVTDSLAGEVISTGQPIILTSKDLTKIKTSYLVRSLIYVPLKFKGRIGGVLTVDNRQQMWDFDNHHLRLLSTLADYAAISLENAHLFNQVESERAKLNTILTEIEEPVVVVSGDTHRIVVANAAFRNNFVVESGADSVEGQSLTAIVSNPSLQKLVAEAAGSNTIHKAEILLSDGRTYYATLTPVPAVGHTIVMQDVSHFKELDQLKSEFVSTVSHDLRGPLGTIRDYAGMLSTVGPLNDKQTVFLNRISNGVTNLMGLIDELLDLSTIELGVDSEDMAIDLSELAAEIVADRQEHALQRHQRLVYHPANERPAVSGNPLRLKQLVSNLVDNALKYTPEYGQVSVLVQVDGSQVLCKVEDSGMGIAPADLPFVFDKFFRITRNGSSIPGTGLGLSICKSIVAKYDGQIWAESQSGRGSVFTFSLPLLIISDTDYNPAEVDIHPKTPAIPRE